MSQATTFSILKEASGSLWSSAQDHPFVHELADGSLAPVQFSYYLKQDYVYLIAYSRAVSMAAVSAPGLTLLSEFIALAHETLNSEMALHRGYCAQFGISATELELVEASPVCQAYSDFCVSTAVTSDTVGLLAALIPCGVGYAEIGARLAPLLTENPSHPYRRWIETYASVEYRNYADWMVATFNELGEDLPDNRLPGLQDLFNTGCRYEWLFWEMAWTKQKWPL